MKFLVDVCSSSRSLQTMLDNEGHDVVSVLELNPRESDDALLQIAYQEARILITEDKDSGEWVFVHRLPHPTIIRFVEMRVSEQVEAMRELLQDYTNELEEGALIVVTRGRIRVRQPPP